MGLVSTDLMVLQVNADQMVFKVTLVSLVYLVNKAHAENLVIILLVMTDTLVLTEELDIVVIQDRQVSLVNQEISWR